MIEIPQEIFQATIRKHHAYCDEKSLEAFTKKIKRKYKIAGHHIVSTCIFYVLTSKVSSCNPRSTISVSQTEWENRALNHLTGTAYMDLTKQDVLSYADLAAKVRDKRNGFDQVAKLSDAKVKEFKECLLRAQKVALSDKIPQVIKDALKRQASEEGVEEAILKNMGISS